MAFVTLDKPAGKSLRGSMLRGLRFALDRLYLWSGYLAAASMVAILVITVVQIASAIGRVSIGWLCDALRNTARVLTWNAVVMIVACIGVVAALVVGFVMMRAKGA